jgi:steroid delta-isomerase-like uncharacterized protein
VSPTTPGPESAASTALTHWYAAWNAHDVDAISALMTDDVRYEDPSAPRAVMHGRREVEDYVGAAFAAIPDLRLEKLEEWVTAGGAVIASYFRLSGTFESPLTSPGQPALAPTGQRVEVFGMDRSEIRDERLERHQIFWDMAEFGRQMGFFPPRGSRMENVTRRLQHLTARRLHRGPSRSTATPRDEHQQPGVGRALLTPENPEVKSGTPGVAHTRRALRGQSPPREQRR